MQLLLLVILKLKAIYFEKVFFQDIEKVLASKKISFGEKTINTLLVTCTIIIKLSLYI